MSGVEIAGFVLAGFPLLISAAEHYKEGFEPLIKWKRFRTDFIGFIDAVDIEKQLFDQMLERFLISADVPHEELQCFMTILDYEGWQRKDLVDILQSRLGPAYAVYMSTIKTMNNLMGDLQTLLCLKDGKVDWANISARKWDFQLKRIRLSFSKKGANTLAELEAHNRKLRELLDSSDKLDSVKATRRDIRWATVFEDIRQHASSLHTALTNGWHCDCEAPHQAALRLQQRATGDWSSTFNMSFTISKEPKVMKPANVRREVIISIRQDKNSTESFPPKRPNPAPVKGQYPNDLRQNLSDLRHKFGSKSSPQVNNSSHPTSPTSISSPSASSKSGVGPYFAKSDADKSAAVANANETKPLLEDSPRSWPRRPKKLPKYVPLDLVTGLPIRHLTPSTPAPAPAGEAPIIPNVGILGLKSNKKKSVRMDLPPEIPIHHSAPAATEAHIGPKVKIKDLCSALFVLDPNTYCLGYLPDDQQRNHELRLIKEAQFSYENGRVVNLETLLTGTKLSRRDRYKIAGILASSLLQLQTTPWLANRMEKKTIFFYQHGSEVLTEHPYIYQSFLSTKTKPSQEQSISPPASRFAARNSLSNLGILLLELCFGQVIESQNMWKYYLGSDGKPHESTDYMTARDWVEMVFEEDPDLENIIKCLLFCPFDEKADWNNKKFTQVVYTSVVEPLEKMINKWSAS